MNRVAAELGDLLGDEVLTILCRPDVKSVYVNAHSDIVRFTTGPGAHGELAVRLDAEAVERIVRLAAAYAEEQVSETEPILWVELPRDRFDGAMFQAMVPPITEAPSFQIVTRARLAEIEEIQRQRDAHYGVTSRRRPTVTSPGVTQQAHGKHGESLTEGVLLGGLWVLRRGVDVDGADFLVQVPPEDALEALEPFQTFGRVQSKYFQGRNPVRIRREHVADDTGLRDDYFLFIHSEDETGHPVRYFLTAAEIDTALPLDARGRHYVFRLGKSVSHDSFRDRSPRWILNTMRRTLRRVHHHRVREMERGATAVFTIASMHSGGRITYLFRSFEGTRIVLYRDSDEGRARVLDARRDLYDSLGDFEWGYRGDGPRLLASSLLAHHLQRAPRIEESDRFLEFLGDLLTDDLDLTSSQVDAILGRRGDAGEVAE